MNHCFVYSYFPLKTIYRTGSILEKYNCRPLHFQRKMRFMFKQFYMAFVYFSKESLKIFALRVKIHIPISLICLSGCICLPASRRDIQEQSHLYSYFPGNVKWSIQPDFSCFIGGGWWVGGWNISLVLEV